MSLLARLRDRLQGAAPKPAKVATSEPEVLLFDTEFSQFRDGELLAIGLVSETSALAAPDPGALPGPELAFYAELHDAALWRRSSDFCHRVVLPQFGRVPDAACPSLPVLGQRLADWLSRRGRPLILGYDYKLDWRFFEAALVAAGRWDALKPRLMGLDIADALACEASRSASGSVMQAFAGGPLLQHHALVDALALAAGWRALPESERAALAARFLPSQDSEATRLARA